MNEEMKLIEALKRLMPKGGWTLEGENIILLEDGIAHGYTQPTQTQIDAAIAEVEALEYREKRAEAYPAMGDQLDALWKELLPSTPEAQEIKNQILSIKAQFPKSA